MQNGSQRPPGARRGAFQQRRSGAITFGDLAGRIDVLRVACRKCERAGQYRVARLIERRGADAGLPDWKDAITADCPQRAKLGATWDVCGAHFPDLNAALYGDGP